MPVSKGLAAAEEASPAWTMAEGWEPEVEAETELEAEARTLNASFAGRTLLPDGRLECEYCGRKFNPASLARHQPVCQKVFGVARPQFVSTQQRTKAYREAWPSRAKTEASEGRRSLRQLPSDTVVGAGSSVGNAAAQQTGSAATAASPVLPADSSSLEMREMEIMQVLNETMEEVCIMRRQACEKPIETAAALPEQLSRTTSLATICGQSNQSEQPEQPRTTSFADQNSNEQPFEELDASASLQNRVGACEQKSSAQAVKKRDQPEQLLWQPSLGPVHEQHPRAGAQGCLGLVKSTQLDKQPSMEDAIPLEEGTGCLGLPESAQLEKQPPVEDADATITPLAAASPAASSSERLLPLPREDAAALPRSPRERIVELPEEQHVELIACDNCRRRFNPASLEKHRNVCRSVFGGQSKRSTFESHQQRLRELRGGNSTPPPPPPPPPAPHPAASSRMTSNAIEPDAPKRRQRASMNVSGPRSSYASSRTAGTSSSSSSLMTFAGQADEAQAIDASPSPSPSPSSGSRDLQPCPHCGRSFRPAVVEKHAKVCRSVFPSHDTGQQRVYDSRHHRLKGTPFEAFSKDDDLLTSDAEATSPSTLPLRAEKRISSTPPRARGVSELRPGMPPPPVGRMNSMKTRSGSPMYSPSMASLEGVLREGASDSAAGESQGVLRRSVSEMLVSSHLPQGASVPASDAPVLALERYASSASSSGIDASSPVSNGVQGFQPWCSVQSTRAESPQVSRVQAFVSPPSPMQGDFRNLVDRRGLLERARLGVKMGQRPEHALLAGSMSEAVLQQRPTDGVQHTPGPAPEVTAQAVDQVPSQHHAQHIPLSSRSRRRVEISGENRRNTISSAQGLLGSTSSAGSRSPKLNSQALVDSDPLGGSLRSLSGSLSSSLSGSLKISGFHTNPAKMGQTVPHTACSSHAKPASPVHAQAHIRAHVSQRTPRASQTQPLAPPPSPATVRRQQLATGLEGACVISPRALARNGAVASQIGMTQATPSPRMSPRGVMASGQVSSPRLSSHSSCGSQGFQLAQTPVTGLLDSSLGPTSTGAVVVPRLDLKKVQQMQQRHQLYK